jgi:hypothetical protein
MTDRCSWRQPVTLTSAGAASDRLHGFVIRFYFVPGTNDPPVSSDVSNYFENLL